VEVTVSLQGSFETFALPDVLILLSSTKKTGELRIVGGGRGVDGCLWVANGLLVESQVGRAHTHGDAIFELLRATGGDFTFESDSVAPGGTKKGVKIEPVLAEAQTRLIEWQEIERFVPSMGASLTFVPEAPAPEITVTADQWRVLAAAGHAADVAGVVDAIGGSEFETCRTVKELVEAGLVRVEGRAPRAETIVVVADPPEPVEVPDVVVTSHPVAEVAIEAPAEEPDQLSVLAHLAGTDDDDDDSDDDDEPINRGLLLKFLSSVRS
jgi:hypothetical protein